jgi:hypothetical protein
LMLPAASVSTCTVGIGCSTAPITTGLQTSAAAVGMYKTGSKHTEMHAVNGVLRTRGMRNTRGIRHPTAGVQVGKELQQRYMARKHQVVLVCLSAGVPVCLWCWTLDVATHT